MEVTLNVIVLPRIGQTAPREVRLFKLGANPTTKGVFLLTKASGAAAQAMFLQQGRALTWDYDHATFTAADPRYRIAAGSCRLAMRADGLWAVDIAWTADAKRDIEAGKWVFCSPALIFNRQREIIGVRNVALTNIPASFDAAPLLLNARDHKMNQQLKDMRSGAEAMMNAAQAMTVEGADPKVKELGGKSIEALTPLIGMLEEMIEAAGEDAKGEGELSQLRGLRTLASELLNIKDADMPTLRGKLRAMAGKSKAAVINAQSAEKTAVLSLVQANLNRIPAAERAVYEALPLKELQAFLSDAPVLVPSQQQVQQQAAAAPKVDNATEAADEETLSAADNIFRAAGRPDLTRAGK